jgi:hypothetical protein
MYSTPTPASFSPFRTARAMNSGPLSERMCTGAPRWRITPSRISATRAAVMPLATSSTRHSRVYSSTTLSHFRGRPSAVRSWMKSHHQTWPLWRAR